MFKKLVQLVLCINTIPVMLMNSETTSVCHKGHRKEMRKMPWYTNPVTTCKVLDRIATRHERTALQDLKSVLDNAIASILKKQEHYYEGCRRK